VFIPGETVSFRFILPFVDEEIVKVITTFKQNDHIVCEIPVESSYIGDGQFVITLSQEQSLLFKDDTDFYIQLNAILNVDGSSIRCASTEIKCSNYRQHIREVVN
jgi:hypothetical protein